MTETRVKLVSKIIKEKEMPDAEVTPDLQPFGEEPNVIRGSIHCSKKRLVPRVVRFANIEI